MRSPSTSSTERAGALLSVLSKAREKLASRLRRIRSAAAHVASSKPPPDPPSYASGRVVVFVDDAAAARGLVDDPSLDPGKAPGPIVIVCTSFDAAYELRAAGATNVRCLSDYAPEHASFDSLYAHYAPVVRERFGPARDARPAEKALFDIVFPDFVRKFAARIFVEDAMRAALRAENATFVAVRVNEGDIGKLAELAELARVDTAQ